MKRYVIFSCLLSVVYIISANAQQASTLLQLKDYSFEVYYSSGFGQRAKTISMRVEKAMKYNQQLLGFTPNFKLLVLATTDWEVNAAKGAVFGMPHYKDKNTLVVAAHDNAFWKSFVPAPGQLPDDISEQIKTVYKTSDTTVSMQAFFDLLAIHELGHAFHQQAGLKMQRNWMSELFVNILLHTYVAENEPESLPALTLFPRMVVAGGSTGFTYTSLEDIQEHYNEVAQKYPRNYGWYQCRWHVAAGRIYDSGGTQVSRKLWDALKMQNEILNDQELIIFLAEKADKSVASMVVDWDNNNTGSQIK